MASLLYPDEDQSQLPTSLLPVDDGTPPVLQADPRADALATVYQQVRDEMARQQRISADRGLWDDQTGLPTGKGLLDAIQQTGTAVALGTSAPGDAPPPSFISYHGSPHDFPPTARNPLGEFSDSAIGSGEGNQAFGMGHYTADAEGVARGYRDRLTPQTVPNPEFHALHTEYNTADAAARDAIMSGTDAQYQAAVAARGAAKAKLDAVQAFIPARSQADIHAAIDAADVHPEVASIARNSVGDPNLPAFLRATAADVDPQYAGQFHQLADKVEAAMKPPGHMYEVKVNADPEHFLDWDKPLSEQHPNVQAALTPEALGLTAFGPVGPKGYYGWADETGKRVGPSLRTGSPGPLFDPKATGQDIYRTLHDNPAVAAEMLQKAGLPGIRYLDAGSRGAGEGSRNSVVFDPATMEIIRKYGLAGLMAGGGAAALSGQQGQQQQ